MRFDFILCILLSVALLSAEEAEPLPLPPEPSPEQITRAEEVLEEILAEDALAEELAPPEADTGLNKDDVLLLRALELDLLEAERWVERGDPVFAGEAFLRARRLISEFDPERIARMKKRLPPLERRLFEVARVLLRDLPISEEVDQVEKEEAGQDDEAELEHEPEEGSEKVREAPAVELGDQAQIDDGE